MAFGQGEVLPQLVAEIAARMSAEQAAGQTQRGTFHGDVQRVNNLSESAVSESYPVVTRVHARIVIIGSE